MVRFGTVDQRLLTMGGLEGGMERVTVARVLVLMLTVVAPLLGGCNMRAIPGLTTPAFALNTPAPLPPPGAPLPLGAGSAPPGVPVVPYPTYHLDAGDRVRIIVFGQDNLSRLYNVDTAGRIAFPLIGNIEARGLTTSQLGSEIEARLRKGYVKDPKVSVEVDAYRPFFILGEVNKPGGYPYVNGMTVEGAVAIAEGYTERAKQRMVRLTRKFGGVMSTVMVPTDYPVQPGDTIYVMERLF
jgi:polysaccharide export outer membrane protein